MFWPREEESGIALFYDVNGVFYESKNVYLPFLPTYLFMEVPNIPGLTMFGDPSEFKEGFEDGAIKRTFKLTYYKNEGTKLFGYYYELDEE